MSDLDFKDAGSSDDTKYDSETLPSAEIKDMKQIQQAAANIARQLEQDEKRLTILDRLASQNNGKYHFDEKRRLIETRFVAIPQAILDQYQHVQLKSFLGLLPLINRAYITIDNTLFLWNYYEGKTFAMYSKLSQVIISLALVKPKPGIFENEIKFVLVLATPVEIIMLGVAFTNDNVYGQIVLYETEFQLPSDNVQFLKIVGTPNGRIFMGGNDGNLYEFDYQTQETWLTKKCRKINHSAYYLTQYMLPSFLLPAAEPIIEIVTDNTRTVPLLFTLSQSNSSANIVQVFSLGADGQGLTLLYRNTTVLSECQALIKDPREKITPDWDAKKFQIVSITPIPANQAERVVLVALTQHGHRIFFSLEHEYPIFGVKGRDILKVRFIRLCPPAISPARDRKSYAPSPIGVDPFYQQGSSPRLVHRSCYSDGVLLMADARTEHDDTLILIDREEHTSRSLNRLVENVESLAGGRPEPRVSGAGIFRSPLAPSTVIPHLKSRIFDIAEMAPTFYLTRDPVASCLFAKNSTRPLESLTEFAIQHAVPPRQFLVLTSNGIHYFKRVRPRDELREILKARHSSDDDTQFKLFIAKYGPTETMSMCFLLACSELETADPGDPEVRSDEFKGSTLGDDVVKAQATQILFLYGHDRVQDDLRKGRAVAPLNRFSVLHEGLALYMSRLLRPVWNWSIVRPPVSADGALRELRFSKLQVLAFISPVAALLKFLGKNRPQLEKFIATLPSTTEPDKGARFSLLGLISLLSLCQEVLHLLHMLCDTNFQRITAMKTVSATSLKQLKFYSLVTSKEGEDVVRSLIDALLQLTLSQPDQDAKINRLSENCPTFFGKSELLYYQAMTWLAKGAWAKKSDERIKCFNQALKCYGRFAASPTFNIHEICQKLHAVHFYTGAIELALFRARLLESRDVVLESGIEEDSLATSTILREKELCYECIFNTLDILVAGSYRIPTRLQIVPKTDGASTSSEEASSGLVAPLDAVRLDEREAEAIKEKAFKLCLDNQDTLFQEKFYRWMIAKYYEQGITYCKEKLLTVPAKQLVPFLTKEENPVYIELLKEYYLKNMMYEEATVLLCELSQKKNDGKEIYYTLKDRIQFLSRALLCAQNCVDTVEQNLSRGSKFPTIDSDTISRIKERIEIAKIQQSIQDALKALAATKEDEEKKIHDRIAELDQLVELEELAQTAEEFDLWEQWLAILNFSQPSHVRDIVVTLWQNIINTEILKSRKRRGDEKMGEDEEKEMIQDWQIRVHNKLVDLSKLYGNNPTMFPRESIAEHLTKCNEDHGDKDPAWVERCLRDCQSVAPRSMAR